MSTSPPPPPSKAASPSPERVGSIRITDEAREEKALGGDGSSLGHSSPQHQQQKHHQPTSAELLKQEEALVSSNATESTRDIGNPNQDLPFSKARCIALVATVTGASFLNTLSGQAVVIILPTIGRDLGIPDSRLQWIVSAYALTFGCFLLLWGRIADIYGKRIIFICGSAWFAVTMLVNPFLPNEIAFDLFRGLQGLGAAANVPTAIGILGVTFPPGKAKNYAFSCYAAGAPLGAIFGTLISGFIAHYTSWKWVFIVIAILATVVTIAAFFIIPKPKHTLHQEGVTAKGSVDWVGAFLVTSGLLALLFALTEGNVVGWSTPWVPVIIVISVILIVLFVLWQRHLEKTKKRAPIMKMSHFKNTQFSAAMLIMALFFSSFNGFLVYATYFYQDFQALNALETTLRFLPTGISGILTAVIVSQLLSRVPTYLMLTVGNFCVSISALLFAVPIPPETTYWAYGFPAMVISVFGADTTWPCLILFTSHSLPQADQALGGALVNAMGQVGRAVSLAVATAIQTAVMAQDRGVHVQNAGPVRPWDEPSLRGLRAAEWWNFALGVSALTVVLAAFRGSGIIGRAGVPRIEKPADSQGESGMEIETESTRAKATQAGESNNAK